MIVSHIWLLKRDTPIYLVILESRQLQNCGFMPLKVYASYLPYISKKTDFNKQPIEIMNSSTVLLIENFDKVLYILKEH